MDLPTKFNGMTDEEIGAYLNVDGNIENLIASEISWMFLNKPPIINLIDFSHLSIFNDKISSTDFSKDLTTSQSLSVINNPDLTTIEKTGIEEVLEGDITVKSNKTTKLNLKSLSSALSSSTGGTSGAAGLLAKSSFINEIIGVVSILDLVSNNVPKLKTLATSFSQAANAGFAGLFTGIKDMSAGVPGIPPDLKGATDTGFGFINSVGGSSGTGTLLGYGGTQTPAASTSTSTTTSTGTSADTTSYKKLEDVLTRTISQDWKAKNAKPGNPLILEAYALSGRNYDKDGTSGEYAWAAAYVNWVLNKSGLDYMKVMSPSAYAGYGNPVDFGTFKKVRKNDLIIMTSVHGLGHIGFIRAYDPKTNLVTVLGGNQAGMVKLTKITISRSDPTLYVSHIRRNWTIPADLDVPLFQTTLPTRPGQQTSGATTRDTRAGGTGAASGGTLV